MNKKLIIAALIAVGLVVAIGVNWASARGRSARDAQSLKAQRSAMGMPSGGPGGPGGPGGSAGPGGPGGPGGFGDQMAQTLGLTDDQKKQLEELNKDMPRPKPGEQPSQADMDAMRKSFEERQSKIESILTPEQKKKFEAMRQQGPGGMPPGGAPPSGGPGGPPQGENR